MYMLEKTSDLFFSSQKLSEIIYYISLPMLSLDFRLYLVICQRVVHVTLVIFHISVYNYYADVRTKMCL